MATQSIFHEGEQEIQKRAEVEDLSRRIGASIHSVIPPIAQQFLLSQTMLIITGIDRLGKVWTSLINDQPGFMSSPDEKTLCIRALPATGDPLREVLESAMQKQIGCIIVEFNTRRRMRVNGQAKWSENGIEVTVQQVYSNCHKYIHPRPALADFSKHTATVQKGINLNEEQMNWIREADTFFIGSAHPERGADASHRGGEPGFVRIVNSRTLLFPDYRGNNLFNTLGNIVVYPEIGLLFIDFHHGSTLQLAGKADIHWETEYTASFPGAERAVEFELGQIVETQRS